MLHIILAILKVIGIILAAILGLLLVMVLLVLFVPIRYRLKGHKLDKEIRLQGQVSWLFHIVSVVVKYDMNNLDMRLKIFGIPINLGKKKSRRVKKKKRIKKSDSRSKSYTKEPEYENDSKENNIDEYEIREKLTIYDENKTPDAIESNQDINELITSPGKELIQLEEGIHSEEIQQEKEPNKKREEESVNDSTDSTNKKTSIYDKIKNIWYKMKAFIKKIIDFFKGLKEKCSNIISKIKHLYKKANEILKFLKDDMTKAAWKSIKEQLVVVFKHIKPTYIKGTLHIGTGDPFTTGEILSVLGALYPFYHDKLTVIPDFEQVIYDGDLYIKGRIRIFVLLKATWSLYRDKNIKKIISTFRNRRSKDGK